MTHTLFVYGTLLNGMGLWNDLVGSPFLGHGIVAGVLYDLGGFPGLQEGTGSVYGELYEISPEILNHLDEIEGYSPENPYSSLYLRKEISVQKFNEDFSVRAYSYFYNKSIENIRKIPSGDYRRDRLEQPHDLSEAQQWYIAYGSNMDSTRLMKRLNLDHIPSADKEVGYLEGYALRFNKAANNGTVYANIAYQGPGYRCPFVAYRLTQRHMETLDRYEGEPFHYVRVGLPFPKADGTYGMGHIYMAHVEKLVPDRNPAAEYLEHLRRGYQEHHFDPNDLDQCIHQCFQRPLFEDSCRVVRTWSLQRG